MTANTLYKRNKFQEAAHRYTYALRRIPVTNNNNLSKRLTLVEDQDAESLFDQLKTHLLLNLSRCQRKLSDWDGAVESATQVIEEVPPSDGSHLTALQARAKAYKESGQLDLGLQGLDCSLTAQSQQSRFASHDLKGQ